MAADPPHHPTGVVPGITLFAVGCLVVWDGCRSAEDRYQEYTPKRSGPVVETLPARLKSCSPKPRPRVERVKVAGAPLRVTVVRAYHLCLGRHVALLRLDKARRKAIQVVLEYEQYDVLGRRPPRRTVLPLTWAFAPRTVRYKRIEFREGRVYADERGLRVRLAAVDFADGTRWTAPPWPPSPAATPPARPQPGPLAPVDKLHKSLRDAAKSVRKQGQKLRKTKPKKK